MRSQPHRRGSWVSFSHLRLRPGLWPLGPGPGSPGGSWGAAHGPCDGATSGGGPGRLTVHFSFTAISTRMIERIFSGAVTRYVCPTGVCVSAGRSVLCVRPVPCHTPTQACRGVRVPLSVRS